MRDLMKVGRPRNSSRFQGFFVFEDFALGSAQSKFFERLTPDHRFPDLPE